MQFYRPVILQTGPGRIQPKNVDKQMCHSSTVELSPFHRAFVPTGAAVMPAGRAHHGNASRNPNIKIVILFYPRAHMTATVAQQATMQKLSTDSPTCKANQTMKRRTSFALTLQGKKDAFCIIDLY